MQVYEKMIRTFIDQLFSSVTACKTFVLLHSQNNTHWSQFICLDCWMPLPITHLLFKVQVTQATIILLHICACRAPAEDVGPRQPEIITLTDSGHSPVSDMI